MKKVHRTRGQVLGGRFLTTNKAPKAASKPTNQRTIHRDHNHLRAPQTELS